MRKAIVFLMLLHTTICVAAQPKGLDFSPYKTDIETLSFEVLDVNFDIGYVAFKHTYEIMVQEDETGAVYQMPCDCGYAGMQDKPLAGVILGVFNLNKSDFEKVFIVYESVDGHENCTKIEDSQNRLAEAKAYFKSLDLDISKKPSSFEITNQSYIAISNNGIDIQLDIVSEVVEDKEDFMQMTSHYKIAKSGVLAFEEKFVYSPVMAGNGYIKFISYYRKGSKVVILEKYIHSSGMIGYTHNEFYSFSPIIDMKDL